MSTIAVLGLGEAGARYAADLLAAGIAVTGYDPAGTDSRPSPPGLRRAANEAEAVRDAEVVLSLSAAGAAELAARNAVSGLRPGTVFADLNTASPQDKRTVAAVVEDAGALFADVAVLAPVSRSGLRTPLAVAGTGRARLAAFLQPLGVPVEDAGPCPGAAAARKLLRSAFMKGLAAVVTESLEMAARAGQEAWLWEQILSEFTGADGALATRLVQGTRQHAKRRLDEMRAVDAYAAELGTADPVVRAVIARLEAISEDSA